MYYTVGLAVYNKSMLVLVCESRECDTRGQEEKKVVKVQLTITLLCVTYRATHGSAKEARRVAKRTGNDQRLELIIDLRQPGKRVEKK